MAAKKEMLLVFVCCLVLLCTNIKAAEELEMAWMRKVSLQGATVAAVVGDSSGCTFVTGDTSEDFGQIFEWDIIVSIYKSYCEKSTF